MSCEVLIKKTPLVEFKRLSSISKYPEYEEDNIEIKSKVEEEDAVAEPNRISSPPLAAPHDGTPAAMVKIFPVDPIPSFDRVFVALAYKISPSVYVV